MGDSVLLRRIPPAWAILDQNQNRVRPSSQAFQNQRGFNAFSAYLDEMLDNPEQAIDGHDGYGLVSFTSSFAESVGQTVVPVPDDDDPVAGHAHVNVEGKKSGSVKKKFVNASEWVIKPS